MTLTSTPTEPILVGIKRRKVQRILAPLQPRCRDRYQVRVRAVIAVLEVPDPRGRREGRVHRCQIDPVLQAWDAAECHQMARVVTPLCAAQRLA